ncbi:hypothetical protein EWM64_g4854 [Hericium alpestre]|uniref:Uncharacterized protein n=1 Tax=Hericium alpestre TaxID=135208 RepID=A0A4Y9ZY83_9AGAM|nr:hypothetical protein EWM64_g4854 [Hericium alpestre]
MSITVAQAELLALCFEIFFFGIFVILAVGVLIILLHTEGRAHSSKLLPVGLALMLGLSLTHVLLSTTEDFFAFFSSEGAEKYYGKRSGVDALFLARGSIMNIQVITGDCINVWRLWIISNKRRLPVVPPVLGIVGYIVTVLGGSLGRSSDPFGLGNSWITACAVLTIIYRY